MFGLLKYIKDSVVLCYIKVFNILFKSYYNILYHIMLKIMIKYTTVDLLKNTELYGKCIYKIYWVRKGGMFGLI